MELLSRGGETFILPADSGNKITNVRKWEQAFRIYAAIYSQASPTRASKIWQYVYVINSAVSTYHWDNISSYNYMFRQLMACNPMRNWSNIYHQMWNLTMRDVIPKNPSYGDSFGNRKDKKKGGRKSGANHCRAFNRGEKCKYDPNCPYPKRCSYCDSPQHSCYECPKLRDKGNQNGQWKSN